MTNTPHPDFVELYEEWVRTEIFEPFWAKNRDFHFTGSKNMEWEDDGYVDGDVNYAWELFKVAFMMGRDSAFEEA